MNTNIPILQNYNAFLALFYYFYFVLYHFEVVGMKFELLAEWVLASAITFTGALKRKERCCHKAPRRP